MPQLADDIFDRLIPDKPAAPAGDIFDQLIPDTPPIGHPPQPQFMGGFLGPQHEQPDQGVLDEFSGESIATDEYLKMLRPKMPAVGTVSLEQAEQDLGKRIKGAEFERSAVGEILAGLGRGVITGLEGLVRVPEMFGASEFTGDVLQGVTQDRLRPSKEVESATWQPSSWRWWAARGPEAIGTMAPMIIPAGAVASIASRAGASARLIKLFAIGTGSTVAGAMEAGLSFGEMRDKLMKRGYSRAESIKIARMGAIAYGFASGITESIPMSAMVKRVPGFKKKLMQALTAAMEEGGQEALQTVMERAAQVITGADPRALDWTEEFRNELKASGALGAVAGTGGRVMFGGAEEAKPTQVSPPEVQVSEPTPPSKSKLPTPVKPAPKQPSPTPDPVTTSAPTNVTPPPKPPETAQEGSNEYFEIAAKMASMDVHRDDLGLPGLDSAEHRSWNKDLSDAIDQNLPDQATGIATGVLSSPRALSSTETAGMTLRAAQLKNRHNAATKRMVETTSEAESQTLANEVERIENEFNVISRALRRSGTEKGRALAAQKLTLNQDYSLVAIKSRAKAARGEALTEKQSKKATELVKQLEEAQAEITRLREVDQSRSALRALKSKPKRLTRMSLAAKDTELASLKKRASELVKAGCAKN